ncbi:bZIP transcription factor [Foetidibacter luteolus]|uniref:bZIP transcription factor n=1 Tax=Foetidibacter luteolus TaxID=2608880 RepID=UPI00129A6215|nr:bZIP transcription factor [Foetidibacter luteolus]
MKKKSAIAIATLMLCITQNINAQSWVIGGNSTTKDTTFGTKTNFGIRFIVNNTERMRLTNAGYLSLGTSAVKAKLTVNGGLSNTSAIMGSNNRGIAFTYDDPAVGFNVYRSSGWKALADGYGGYITLENTSGRMQFATSPSALKDAAAAAVVRMSITQDGNVGIGTTVPNARLHVNGSQTLNGNLSFTLGSQSIQFANPGASPAPMMYMFASGTTNPARMVIAHSPAFPSWGLQYSDPADQFDFLGAGISRMHINLGSGNIGIGTTTPAYRLDVCGTIRAREVRVETGWCDYVFEKNYKLRSIDDLEQYINDNKHLPGIAPASEVEKEGLKVAEMNKAMMEKIEELTLYVIQLSKENKKLQQQIDALKK